MKVREAVLAGSWYEGSSAGCARAIARLTQGYQPPQDLARVYGGVVPHAGWVYSGATAGKVLAAIRAVTEPEVFVLFGTHAQGIRPAAVDTHDAWDTPLGPVPVDDELRQALLEQAAGALTASSAPLRPGENSLEIQMPLVRSLFPAAKILPIGVYRAPSAADVAQIRAVSDTAIAAGRAAAAAVQKLGRRAVFIASSDLTHYGANYDDNSHGPLPEALPWMKGNDRRVITLIERLDAAALVPEIAQHRNACGEGALAAGTAAAAAAGATAARLLEYTTSMEVTGERWAGSAVGYAGMVFYAPGAGPQ